MFRAIRLIPCLFYLALSLCSCSQTNDEVSANDKLCVIKGQVTDTDIPYYCKHMIVEDAWNGYKDIASSRIDKDGNFSIEIDASNPTHVYLYAGKLGDRQKRVQFRDFIMEPGTIEVSGDFSDECVVFLREEGTPLNDKWKEFLAKRKAETDPGLKRQLFEDFMSESTEDELRLLALEKLASPNSDIYIKANCYRLFKTLDERLQKGRYSSESLDEYFKNITASCSYYAPGASYHDVQGTSLDGERKDLSGYFNKGKYVLLDFWGTWCSPCVKSIPALADFADKNRDIITIVGINVNEPLTLKELACFADEHRITWDLIVADKGEADYVLEFPTTFLYDDTGKLIQADHPEDLLPKIEELISDKNKGAVNF